MGVPVPGLRRRLERVSEMRWVLEARVAQGIEIPESVEGAPWGKRSRFPGRGGFASGAFESAGAGRTAVEE